MSGALQHPLRVGRRLIGLAGGLLLVALAFVFRVLLRPGSSSLEARACWLQAACRRGLRLFNAEVVIAGPVPKRGLLVSNHLSYLDILVLSALTPAVFVAKREVKSWPVFGWLAQLGGTLFTDRERRTQVGPLAKDLRTLLERGALVILFPEGTSSNGQTVLPFKSALLEPATNSSHPVTASSIEYRLEDGIVGEEVCYWKNMAFVPHLLNLLSKKRITASVRFSEIRPGSANRKVLARQLHAEVMKLKDHSAERAVGERHRFQPFGGRLAIPQDEVPFCTCGFACGGSRGQGVGYLEQHQGCPNESGTSHDLARVER